MMRAHISLLSHGSRVQVSASSLPPDARPDGWQWLSGWTDSGWFPIHSSGNELHDFALVMEQHWGEPMRLAAFVTVKESKDDDTIKIKARTDDVAELPDDWDSGLAAWTKAGWDLVQVTGNRENGWGWLLVKGETEDETEDENEEV